MCRLAPGRSTELTYAAGPTAENTMSTPLFTAFDSHAGTVKHKAERLAGAETW